MPHCHHCGSLLEEDTAICAQCGAPQTETVTDTPEPAVPISLEKREEAISEESVIAGTGDDRTFTERFFPLLMGGGIAGILAILAIFLLLFLPPKQAKWETPILRAFEDTHAAVMAEFTEASDKLGLAPVLKELAKKGMTQDFTLSIPFENRGDISLHLLRAGDAKLDQAYALMDANMLGLRLTLMEFSLEKNFVALASPFLFKGVYGLSLDNIAALPSSALGQQFDIDEEGYMALADYLRAALRFQANGSTLSEATLGGLRSALLTLEGALLCSAPTEELVSFDTGDLSCSVYTAQIPIDALETFLLEGADALLGEEIVSAYFRLFYALEESSDLDPIAEIKAEWADEVRDLCEELQAAELTVYLRDGMALRTELTLRDRYDEDLQLILQLSGTGNLTDRLTFQLMSEYTNYLSVFWQGNLIPRDGVAEGSLQLVTSEGDGFTAMGHVTFQWDTKKTSNNLRLDASVSDNLSASYLTTRLTLEGDVSLTGDILLDSLKFLYTDNYGNEYTASGSVHIRPTQELKSLTAQATDLLSMDSDALQALLREIESSSSRLDGFL